MVYKIVTIVDPRPNYGNQLQNYAVQSVIARLTGTKPQTLVFEKKWDTSWKADLRYIVNLLTQFRFSNSPEYWKFDFFRAKSFAIFRRNYIESETINEIPTGDEADYYILGSDQVWNPMWYHLHPWRKDIFLLTFAPSAKRVCIAPSFGICDLPGEWIEWFKNNLKEFPRLAVREAEGALLIKRITGRDAYVMIDPTLMLDIDDWIKIAKKPKRVDTTIKYVLVYVLGNITDEMERDISYLENNYRIYNITLKSNRNLYAVSPDEFLYLVQHAEMIITDSFHACVFSFLFERPFAVYEREGLEIKMGSRICSLLKLLSLEDRYVLKNKKTDLDKLMQVDYSEGKEVISEKRKEAELFLKKELNL